MKTKFLGVCAVLAMTLAACGDGKPASQNAEPSSSAEMPAPAQPAAAPVEIAASGGMTKEELASKICFFTPEEIATAMGFSVAAGKPETSMLAEYGTANCRYEGKENTLQINAMWLEPTQGDSARHTLTSQIAGERDVLAGDPDGAVVQYQKRIRSGALHYVRQNIMMEVRPSTWRGDPAAMKEKLLKLRRVP